MKRIGYLGPQASFSEEALYTFLRRKKEESKVELRRYNSIPLLLKACQEKKLDFAFLPIENSTEGQVTVTADVLRDMDTLYIVEEYIHPIRQCLLAPRLLPLREVSRIYSHEQALGQCRTFIDEHLASAEQVTCLSTSEAVRMIADTTEKWAAIGSRRASEVYKLAVLEEGIEDTDTNATRFIMLGHHMAEMTGNDKTSILFATPNTPGALSNVLTEFVKRDINLTRIESRPAKQKLGEYVFYIDFDGYVFSQPIQDVLWALRDCDVWVKLLGSYPKAKNHLPKNNKETSQTKL